MDHTWQNRWYYKAGDLSELQYAALRQMEDSSIKTYLTARCIPKC
jgi:hypothetical protein